MGWTTTPLRAPPLAAGGGPLRSLRLLACEPYGAFSSVCERIDRPPLCAKSYPVRGLLWVRLCLAVWLWWVVRR